MGRIETFTLDIEPLGQSPRTIYVYLPNSYDHSKKKYDVLYMFDGHNLFDDATATYGKSWGIKKYLDENDIDLVVIGQDCNHEGHTRLDEYCPFPSKKRAFNHTIHHLGDKTAEWFTTTLKKECEKRYRIFKDRKHVGIGGSSMGGLMSQYCIAKYNHIYSKAACVSSASIFCLDELKDLLKSSSYKKDTYIYMNYGSEETGNKAGLARVTKMTLDINHIYTEKGCHTYPELIVNGTHSEATWETTVPTFLQYLYPHLFD